MGSQSPPLDIQEKYTAEATKRLRAEGTAQFQELAQSASARLKKLASDPWAPAVTTSPPALKSGDRVKFLIAGAGIGGILSAVRLMVAGFSASQIRMVESAGGAGGTWYWNRYPGLHCDAESYAYLPLLEETGYMPSQRYAPGCEIRAHLDSILDRYDLRDKVLFRTKLEGLQWEEKDGNGEACWQAQLTTTSQNGDEEKSHSFTIHADFAILTAGYLSKPHVPKFGKGNLETFQGTMFHTARWDYDATGGKSDQQFPELDKLRDKRVGVIGTGATAVQVIPCLAEYAKELLVFQRTPSAVYRRDQRATDPGEWEQRITAGGKKGWQRERMRNMNMFLTNCATPETPNLVDDEWTKQTAYAAVLGSPSDGPVTPDQLPALIGKYMKIDAANREAVRRRVTEIVKDEETARKLQAWYPVWCKRPVFSDIYLQTFNRPNVRLIDTDGRGVDGVTESGLLFDGQTYDLDILVLATGYVSPAAEGGDPGARSGVDIMGRNGLPMADKWQRRGLATLHGCATSAFPNLFFYGAFQAAPDANVTHQLEVQSTHVAHIIAAAHKRVAADENDWTLSQPIVEVEEDAEEAWSMRCLQGAARWGVSATCTPSYMNSEGEHMRMAMNQSGGLDEGQKAAMMKRARASPLAGGLISYQDELQSWRSEGTLRGYTVSAA